MTILIVLALGIGVGVTLWLAATVRRLREAFEQSERFVRDDLSKGREESALQSRQLREELSGASRSQTDSLLGRLSDIATLQKNQLDSFTEAVDSRLESMRSTMRDQLDSFGKQLKAVVESNDSRLESMRQTLQQSIKDLQADNAEKLETMRRTVDEKLHQTLETRLTESFSLVSQRLDAVQKGLGEMQSLASGVGDLKRLLTNVKARGTWGEVFLKSIVGELLIKDQFAENVRTKTNNEAVEVAIKLPGKDDSLEKPVWLPIDSKLPMSAYERIVQAREQADPAALDSAMKELVQAVKKQAKDIQSKYINPPATTDFAIMYLPTEGLYAEIMQVSDLHQSIQREYRVMIAGPSTLAAFLNSLQMGFRTLAIEKKSSEVWKVLGAIKTEFLKFGGILENTQRKIMSAHDEVEKAALKTRNIARKLNKVQELPADEAQELLLPDAAETLEELPPGPAANA